MNVLLMKHIYNPEVIIKIDERGRRDKGNRAERLSVEETEEVDDTEEVEETEEMEVETGARKALICRGC
jgi:Fic family protein